LSVLKFFRLKSSSLLLFVVFIYSNSNNIYSQQITPILFETVPLENQSKLTDLNNVIGYLDFDEKVLNDLFLLDTDTFQLVIDDQSIIFVLHKKIEYEDGVISLLASRANEDLVSLVLTIGKNRFNGTIYNLRGEKTIKIRYLPEVNKNLVYYEVDLNDFHEGEPLKIPSRKDKIDHSKKGMDLAEPTDTTTVDIDVLVVYTDAAESWANTNHGGIDIVIAQNFAYSQSAADNSEIYMNFNVVHSEKIDYSESAASTDLDRITFIDDGYMDEVHSLRNEHSADLVMYFSYGFDTGGLAWILEDTLGRPEYGFGLVRINYAYESATVHEMAHTMGSMHSRTQTIQPAPDYGALFNYSTGWRWDGDENKSYFSIMSYKENSDVRVPLFSNPNVEYAGAPTGSYTGVGAPSDNARSLNQIRYVIANYRNERVDGDFYLANNGVTIMCPDVYVGATEVINGIEYTKRSSNQITPENASTSCTSSIRDFSNLFYNEYQFNENISHWDMSDATTTYAMFWEARAFNQDISQWDVSNIENFDYMFGASSQNMTFNADISEWNTSSGTSMEGMLQLSADFNHNIGKWDVSNVTNMDYMLYGASSFDQNLSNWCVENITNEPRSFSYNSALSTNNLPVWGTCKNRKPTIALTLPSNNSTFSSNRVNFEWNAIDSVDNYSIQIGYENLNTLIFDTVITDATFSATFESEQVYAWRVKGFYNSNSTDWSEIRTFSIILASPILRTPQNQEINVGIIPVFEWEKVSSADFYQLQISNDSTFNSVLLDLKYDANYLESNSFTLPSQLKQNTSYYWRMKSISETDFFNSDWSEMFSFTTGVRTSTEDELIPEEYTLSQNYPNPFNPSTQIQYALPEATQVTLEVFNSVGQKVMELMNGQKSAGYHTTTFDASGLSSGVYLYKLTTPSFTQTKKMLLIK
jgi:hypothetical protein